ncbi:hypothetical protein BDC45DRAFT_531985 [Circinella umbellata]|nr:hypothetical protein BDC45DRAFT_531985 [Circinella umbellata]
MTTEPTIATILIEMEIVIINIIIATTTMTIDLTIIDHNNITQYAKYAIKKHAQQATQKYTNVLEEEGTYEPNIFDKAIQHTQIGYVSEHQTNQNNHHSPFRFLTNIDINSQLMQILNFNKFIDVQLYVPPYSNNQLQAWSFQTYQYMFNNFYINTKKQLIAKIPIIHHIQTGDTLPIYRHDYHRSPLEKQQLANACDKLLK